MLVGVLAGLLAGAFWGLSFIAPLAVAPFTGFDLTVVRYAVYALAALAVLARGGFAALRGLDRGTACEVVVLGFTGYTGYYLAVALAVPLAGTPPTVLIIGALPIVLALAGHRRDDVVTLPRLALPLTLILVGLLVVNGEALARSAIPTERGAVALGIALAIAGLALWTIYGLRNARALAARPAMSDADWAALTGLGALVSALPLIPIAMAFGLSGFPGAARAPGALGSLLLWGAITGVLSSLVATWLWAMASRRLPLSLAGQLIVSETIFGIVFALAWDGRGPTLAEAGGGALLVAGVVVAVRTFERRPRRDLSPG
jgi:drug/metabolite transporter (DMT)-like permease